MESQISIFVSHEVPNPYLIKNSLYNHVTGQFKAMYNLCVGSICDDSSSLEISSNKFAVQYEAWKNTSYDYYGLFHNGRYLSFYDVSCETHEGFIIEKALSKRTAKKYGLMDRKKINDIITSNDFIVARSTSINEIMSGCNTVKESLLFSDTLYHPEETIRVVLELIKANYSEYYESAVEYLKGNDYYGHNLFVMKKNLFHELCNFERPILFELQKKMPVILFGQNDCSLECIGHLLFGVFVYHTIKLNKYKYEVLQPVLFLNENTNQKTMISIFDIREYFRTLFITTMNAEKEIKKLNRVSGANVSAYSIADSLSFKAACFALELHDIHRSSFLEFKNVNEGKDVVVVGTGPTLKFYEYMENAIHIGVNKSFLYDNIKLDYYFFTDYKHKPEYINKLINYDFIKFFGQYPPGKYRDSYQVPEHIIQMNNGRKFFGNEPCKDIDKDIEYHPLMGFYSIIFKALHFAAYTNPKTIYLVGCDCSTKGYYDGSVQERSFGEENVLVWLQGYDLFYGFMKQNYPGTELIVINPVGLKNRFKELYTERYLDSIHADDVIEANINSNRVPES